MAVDPEVLSDPGEQAQEQIDAVAESPHLVIAEDAPDDIRDTLLSCTALISELVQAGASVEDALQQVVPILADPAHAAYFDFDRPTQLAISRNELMRVLRITPTAEPAKAQRLKARRRELRAEIFVRGVYQAGRIGNVVLSSFE